MLQEGIKYGGTPHKETSFHMTVFLHFFWSNQNKDKIRPNNGWYGAEIVLRLNFTLFGNPLVEIRGYLNNLGEGVPKNRDAEK